MDDCLLPPLKSARSDFSSARATSVMSGEGQTSGAAQPGDTPVARFLALMKTLMTAYFHP